MRRFLLLVLLAVPASAFAGKPDIIQIAPDTYMVTVTNHAGIFANEATTKRKAVDAANEFAAAQGKIAVARSLNSSPAYPGHFGTVEYQFIVVSKDDPDAHRVYLKPMSDVTVDVNANSAPSQAPTTTDHSDKYDKLAKLKSLLDSGALTQAEYDSEKVKVLASQ